MALRPTIRFEVFKRDAFTCRYCNRRPPVVVLVVDHIVARVHGGTDEMDNLVTSCEPCNQGKGARRLSHVPPPLDLKEQTARLAEQETQMAEYAQWITARRRREDAELELVREMFAKVPDVSYEADGQQRWFWQDSSARLFLRRLGLDEVLHAIDRVGVRRLRWNIAQSNAQDAWKYFCAICWRKIKSLTPIEPKEPPPPPATPRPRPDHFEDCACEDCQP